MRARSWLVGGVISVVAFLAAGLAVPAFAAEPAAASAIAHSDGVMVSGAAAKAERAAARAEQAAAELEGAVIPAAKKAAKKAAKAAARAQRAAEVLRALPAAAQSATAVAQVDDATATARTAAKKARKWAKRIAKSLASCPETARACVDLTNSMSWLQKNGKVTYGPVKITSGRAGFYRTRPGMWTVFWKSKNHVSSYWGTPMPNSVFFDRVGIAFHQGSLKELSHGCVHLGSKASQAYWDALHNGDRVFVFGYAPYTEGQDRV